MFDLETFEERAAIMEFDGGLPRSDAERLALLDQSGYCCAALPDCCQCPVKLPDHPNHKLLIALICAAQCAHNGHYVKPA